MKLFFKKADDQAAPASPGALPQTTPVFPDVAAPGAAANVPQPIPPESGALAPAGSDENPVKELERKLIEALGAEN